MDTIKLAVLHTNDLHSTFEAMPRIATFFASWEERVPRERQLRFDIGDHMDRMRPETEGTLGLANIAVMNATGYDAFVPGNNEGLTLTPEMLDEAFGRQARFSTLGANLLRLEASEGAAAGALRRPEWLKPYLILERCGIRVAAIGLTVAFNDFYEALGWHAEQPIECAAKWVDYVRREECADIVIVLSHLGLPNDKRLAEEISGIDLILGGHTHHLLEETIVVGRTCIAAAGKFGSHAGVVEMEVDRTSRRPVSIRGRAEDLAAYEPSAELAALIEMRAAAAREALQRVVAVLDRPLPTELERESPLGNLLAADLRRRYKAEAGIVNAGQLLDGLGAGPLTAERLLAVCPSPINPCTMRLRGKHILQALEESLLPDYIRMPIRGFGFRGKALGTLCLDGMRVEYAPEAAALSRVRRVFVGDRPLDPDREYTVATLDMFTFRIGYLSLSQGTEIKYYLPEFIRDCLAERLRLGAQEEQEAACVPRWTELQ